MPSFKMGRPLEPVACRRWFGSGQASECRESCVCEPARLLRSFEPVDPIDDILHLFASLGQRETLLDQAGDDVFNKLNFSVFEALEAPVVEFEAQDLCFIFESGLIIFRTLDLPSP